MDQKYQPKVFLAATLWWPASTRLALAFLHHGCRVTAICPTGHPLRAVTGIESTYRYQPVNSSASLEAAIIAERPELVVPCDDGAVWQLYELSAKNAALRPLIERSLGSSEAFPTLRSRFQVLQAAAGLGIRVPRTQAVESAAGFRDSSLEWPAILKVDGTWGGEGVSIVRDAEDAARAFHSLFGLRRSAGAWKRFFVNRHPLALWLWRQRKQSIVTLQQFISGRPATSMFACWRGEVLGRITVEVLASQGPTGSANIVRLLKNEEIDRAACLLARHFKLSGFHGLDFMIEDGTQAAYMIEMNPRATQIGHLNVCPQGNLADVLASRLIEEPPSSTDRALRTPQIPNDTIALFPQAFRGDRLSPLMASAYHDIPREDPALAEELMREPWPERGMLNRIFARLGMRRPDSFEQPGAQSGKGRSSFVG